MRSRNSRSKWLCMVALPLLIASGVATPQTPPPAPVLDENCVVNVLNRTVQVLPGGGWVMPNVPSNMGQIRARATCTQGTQTISGETDYFSVPTNGVATVGPMKFEGQEQVPVSLAYTENGTITLSTVGASHPLGVRATYPDGSVREVTASTEGTNYSSTNASIASVDVEGVVTAHSSGTVLITARKDEVVAFKQITVDVAGDKDHDGLPDDYELANGLNPNDPIDAQEDQDGDGLTALQEFQHGTNPRNADSDGDGLSDGEEVTPGTDGFITNPLNADTDGDGLSDRLEVLAGSNPTDPKDTNLAAVLDSITVNPPSLTLTFNSVDTEVSARVTVTGLLIDGSTVNLTAKRTGTTYTSSNLAVASFGATDGEIFGGSDGSATVTIANNGKQTTLPVTVVRFQPVGLSSIAIPGYANNVDVSGDFAYVAAGSAGLVVLDVSDRSHPAIVGQLDTNGTAIDVRVVGRFAYLADGEAGFKIIDVATPSAPVLVGAFDTAGVAQDLKVDGKFAYVADGTKGIVIFDVSDPTHPIAVSQLIGIGETKGIDVAGNRAVVVADVSLFVLDVTNRAAPSILGSVGIGAVKDVAMDANYAYVAAYTNGYRVVRITDPAHPFVITTSDSASFQPRDVEVVDGLALFAEQVFPNVIAVVNVKNPELPAFQATIDLSPLGDYAGTGIALDGSFAYVTEESVVVGQDFGVTGNTRLFIAQYRQTTDSGGIAPTVSIDMPAGPVIEGGSLPVNVQASDDIGVRDVRLTVNGTPSGVDTARPYQIPVAIPFGTASLTIVATATDFGGNTQTAQIVVPVLPDSDHDRLDDDSETNIYHTDPHNADTDGDGLSDGREIALGTNPLAADTDGDGQSDLAEVNADTDPLSADVTPPTVSVIDPADGATNVIENNPVVVTFNEPLRDRSLSPSNIQIKLGDTVVPGTVRLMPNGVGLAFTPTPQLASDSSFSVTVSGVRDSAGNVQAAPFHSTFATGHIADNTPPTIVATSPSQSATGVPINTAIVVVMSEAIDPLSVTSTNLSLTAGGGVTPVAGVGTLLADGRTLVFVPNAPLPLSSSCSLIVRVKDLKGNSTFNGLSFTTGFAADGTSPVLVATSIADGFTVPTNVTLSARFNEPLNVTTLGNITLTQGGTQVSVQRQLTTDTAGTVVKLVPTVALSANTPYTFSVGAVQDLSGNVLAASRTVNFTTGAGQDNATPVVVSTSPANGQTDTPRNAILEVRFDKRINPVTFQRTSVRLLNGSVFPIVAVAGTASLTDDGMAVRFTPTIPLVALNNYELDVSPFDGTRVEDLSGHTATGSTNFNTGTATDTTPPALQLASIADGATAVPVNGKIVLQFDTPVADRCVNSNTVFLTNGGAAVASNATLSADHRTLTITPQAALAVSTAYTVHLQGVCDVAGNVLPTFTSAFTTSTSATPDTTAPTVTITPAQNATNVPVTTPIVMAFNEPMDVTTLAAAVHVTAQGFQREVAGNLTINANQLTFTPIDALPGNKTISVAVNSARDLAGNTMVSAFRSFSTGTAGDTTPPSIISMVPNDQLVGVSPSNPIVLTFSESIDPATVRTGNFAVFANGAFLTTNMSQSLDSRTVIVNASPPPNSVITVIVTSDVRDLSGNPLPDFVAAYTTGPSAGDTSGPFVTTTFPGAGATGVARDTAIVLYTNEPMNAATVPGALHIAQNGQNVPGTTTLSTDARVITFVPTQPLAGNATVQVFLDSTALDVNGNPHFQSQSSFTTAIDPTINPPSVLAFAPAFGTGVAGVPVNSVIDTLFSEPLDPTSVSTATVTLADNATGTQIPADVSLRNGNRIVRVHPQTLLTPSHLYVVHFLTGVRDASGQNMAAASNQFFNTNAIAVADTVAPNALAISPASGSNGVGITGHVHARFDESINPLTVALTPDQAFGTVFWSDSNRELRFVRHRPYAPNTQVTESVATAEDYAGNPVTSPNTSTTFTTGDGADLAPPTLANVTPASQTLPPNGIVRLVLSEQLDPVSVDATGVLVQDGIVGFNAVNVPVSVTLEPDGRTITIVPATAYPVGHQLSVSTPGVRDLSGNLANQAGTSFTVSFTPDTTAPAVAVTNPPDGFSNVPRNIGLQVKFNEPVNALTLGGVTLKRNGVLVPATPALSGDGRAVTFKLVQPLAPNTTYVLGAAGVQDLSGNTLAASTAVTFTTGVGLDTTAPALSSSSPFPNATGVPLNAAIEMQFSERLNPAAIDVNTISVQGGGRVVDGAVSLTADGTILRFVPSQPLRPNIAYSYLANVQDLAGNAFNSFNSTRSFTTGSASDTTAAQVTLQSIADGATAVPVNGRMVLQFDSALADRCVNGQTVQLITGGNTVAGTLTLSDDRTRLTFVAQAPLAANSSYTLRLHGVCDLAGNSLPDFVSAFTTGATADTTSLQITAATPAQGATNVPTTTAITLTFSEPFDVTTLAGHVHVTVSGVSNEIATSMSVAGNVVTVTPLTPLPGGKTISVSLSGVTDLAGNQNVGFTRTFSTGASTDVTAPTIVSITPANGDIDMPTGTPVVLTFSESMDPSTLKAANLGLIVNGTTVTSNVAVSTDNRTVIVTGGIPVASVVAFVATSDVRDLSGNRLADFVSTFTTTIADNGVNPTVISQFPNKGFTNVRRTANLVLYTSEPLVPSTVPQALHVSQNGVVVNGTVSVASNGREITFHPNQPWAFGSVIEVFFDNNADDVTGHPLTSYRGSFTVLPDPATTAPTVADFSPTTHPQFFRVPLSTVMDALFTEPLDPATVTSANVVLKNSTGAVVPANVSLTKFGLVVHVQPQALLTPNANYSVEFGTGLRGTNGLALPALQAFPLPVSSATVPDTAPPHVLLVSPGDGAKGVGINSQIHWRFDENIARLSLLPDPQLGLGLFVNSTFSPTDIFLVRQEPMPPSTQIAESAAAARDYAGNAVQGPASTTFTTAPTADFDPPKLIDSSPANASTGVPVNAVLRAYLDGPVDPASILSGGVALRDGSTSGATVPATIGLEGDGSIVTIVPSQPLQTNHTYAATAVSLLDSSGNLFPTLSLFQFTTGSATDTLPPTTASTSVQDGALGVQTNVNLQVTFNEPVNTAALGGVVLRLNGIAVPATFNVSADRRTVTLKLVQPLNANTTYTFGVSDVMDLSGNVLATPVNLTFTTGAGAHL